MRPVGSLLERFRRPAAVPAAVSGDLEAELVPVFAALDAIEAEAAALGEEARREAERRRAAAAADAEAVLAQARRRAEVARGRAEAEARAAASREAREIAVAAQREAARIRSQGRSRIPPLVDDVLALLTREAE